MCRHLHLIHDALVHLTTVYIEQASSSEMVIPKFSSIAMTSSTLSSPMLLVSRCGQQALQAFS